MRTLVGLLVCVSAIVAMMAGPAAPQSGAIIFKNSNDVTITNPLAAARQPLGSTTVPNAGWATIGAGTIPARATQCGSTIAAYTGTAATINSAIASCTADQHVQLGSGTFNLSTGILFDNKSNVTLRGNGADATFLVFSGSEPCTGLGSNVCMRSTTFLNPFDITPESATWSAGFSQGSTTITLSDKDNLQVGTIVLLLQLSDTGGDTWPEAFVCHSNASPDCAVNPAGGSAMNGREQRQFVQVTTIEGGACAPSCDIGITPGLHMGSWRSGQTPFAYWMNGVPATGMGIEDVSIDGTNGGADNFVFVGVTNSWIKGIRANKTVSRHVRPYASLNLTIRDSYFFSWSTVPSTPAGENFGVDLYFSSNLLIENNIFQRLSSQTVCEEAASGHVVAYNYSLDDDFSYANVEWAMRAHWTHSVGCPMILYEGNAGFGAIGDNEHGSTSFITHFRNNYEGWEDDAALLYNRTPFAIEPFSRHYNIISNVLGRSGFHDTYQVASGITSCDDVPQTSIYFAGCSNSTADDSRTVESMLRWCNWDVVTSTGDNTDGDQTGTKKAAGEVPTGLSQYSNTQPSSDCGAMPDSLYLSAEPAWFGSVTWPPIGPDVSGGTIANKGGHAHKIPAQVCAESIGVAMGQTTARTFNASTCYPTP